MTTKSLIVAVAENGIIGRNNEIPWDLPADRAYFRTKTMGHTIIVGRKTYESIMTRIGKPLPQRRNVVLTKQKNIHSDYIVACSLEEAFFYIPKTEAEIFFIGGADIYALCLPLIDKIYLTKVHAIIDGDTFFPVVDYTDWCLVSSQYYPKDKRNCYAMTFCVYKKTPRLGHSSAFCSARSSKERLAFQKPGKKYGSSHCSLRQSA